MLGGMWVRWEGPPPVNGKVWGTLGSHTKQALENQNGALQDPMENPGKHETHLLLIKFRCFVSPHGHDPLLGTRHCGPRTRQLAREEKMIENV